MAIKGFFEDWDGEIVLGDIRNFKDKKDFMEQAEKYASETRGCKVFLFQPETIDIVYNDNDYDDCWRTKLYAERTKFEGEEVRVYKSTLKQDS